MAVSEVGITEQAVLPVWCSGAGRFRRRFV